MENPWWSSAAHDALTDFVRTPLVLITLIGVFRKRLEYAVLLIGIYYVVLCPFTKVEESFNVQAIHDILFHGVDIDRYDHLEFPGVVPRTMAGPLVVAAVSWPFVMAINRLGFSKLYGLIIVRTVLAALTFVCFRRFTTAIRRSFGSNVAFWTCLLTMVQFHFNFYASRPLPNVFALALAMLTYSCWINGEYKLAIWPAVFSAFIFRSELVLLYAPIFLPLLINGRISIFQAIGHGLCSATLFLGITIPIDSWFWKRWLWPEGEVWYYNVILNKSGDWGTSPFLWYFYSVLPRSLLLSLPLAPIGAYLDTRARTILLPAVCFVALYSLLPHKELRFVIYTFPLFNLASSVASNRIFENRRKSWIRTAFCLATIGHVLVNAFASSIFARATYPNYPGASALHSLQSSENGSNRIRIHIDVFNAQSGITRFLHEYSNWEYNKSETLIEGDASMRDFDYLLIGNFDGRNLTRSIKTYESTHVPIKEIFAFHRLGGLPISRHWPFVKNVDVVLAKRAVILKKIFDHKEFA